MIKNINKRFIASSVALTLLPSVLSGCTANGFSYNEDKNGQVVASGTIDYDYLKNCYYVEIENPNYDKIEYYIAERKGIYESHIYSSSLSGYVYNDLITNKEVYRRNLNDFEYYSQTSNKTNRKFIKEVKVEDYLLSENFIKNAYTADDVKQVFEAIKENEIAKEKELVKE